MMFVIITAVCLLAVGSALVLGLIKSAKTTGKLEEENKENQNDLEKAKNAEAINNRPAGDVNSIIDRL